MGTKKTRIASKEKLEEAYKRLGSLALVAQELGGTKEGIRCAMKRHGLEVKPLIKHSCNENFFAEDNEESFYWAGFIAADGCVKSRKSKELANYLNIALSQNDKAHVESFKNHINTTAPIGNYIVKSSHKNSNWNDTWKSEITITSEKVCKDLEKFNIVKRKTLIYTFPEWLINHPLVNHFMRGYNDGDGSFFFNLGKNKKTAQLFFSLRGTSEFLEMYRKILEKQCNLEIRDKPIRINSNIGVLEYGGNNILKKIVDFLYKDATIYLERKYNISHKQS